MKISSVLFFLQLAAQFFFTEWEETDLKSIQIDRFWEQSQKIFIENASHYKAWNMHKIFSLVLSEKLPTRENWDKLSVHFSIFEWWNWPKHQFCQIAKCQMSFFSITVNFITQKLKSKHLVCLSFLWWQIFLREREKIFYT